MANEAPAPIMASAANIGFFELVDMGVLSAIRSVIVQNSLKRHTPTGHQQMAAVKFSLIRTFGRLRLTPP
jgi:hypothetical protein